VILTYPASNGEKFNNAGFIIPLSDAGGGVVSTTALRATGSATFTRATAAAARLSTGLWNLSVVSGSPRSHYWEFSTGIYTYGGYISEPAATQIISPTKTRDLTDGAVWVSTTMTVAATSTGIDGVANSCSRLTAAGATSTLLQTITAAASTRTFSAFVKRITGTGTILIVQGATTLDITALINTSTFTLVQLPASVVDVVAEIDCTSSKTFVTELLISTYPSPLSVST